MTWTSWPPPPAWAPLVVLPQSLQSGGSAANSLLTATPSVGRQIVVCLFVVFHSFFFVCLWSSVYSCYSPFSVSHFCNTAQLTNACRNADPWYGKKWTCFDALHVYKNRQVLHIYKNRPMQHVCKNRPMQHVCKSNSSARL